MFVIRVKLLKTSFSVQAHSPTRVMRRPVSQKTTFEPNIMYFKQQLISEASEWSDLWSLLSRLSCLRSLWGRPLWELWYRPEATEDDKGWDIGLHWWPKPSLIDLMVAVFVKTFVDRTPSLTLNSITGFHSFLVSISSSLQSIVDRMVHSIVSFESLDFWLTHLSLNIEYPIVGHKSSTNSSVGCLKSHSKRLFICLPLIWWTQTTIQSTLPT